MRFLRLLPLLAACPAWGHVMSMSSGDLTVTGARAHYELRMPLYEIYNPATAQYNAEHAFSIAEYDVMKQGMAPEAATDKAFKRAEEIFAKYPITRHKNVPRHRRG